MTKCTEAGALGAMGPHGTSLFSGNLLKPLLFLSLVPISALGAVGRSRVLLAKSGITQDQV